MRLFVVLKTGVLIDEVMVMLIADPAVFLQISKALAGADKKDLMRKLPKFIYDEEKALEVNIINVYNITFGLPNLINVHG